MKTEKRIAWIDSIKGFAIMCVVMSHVLSGYLDEGMFAEYNGFMLPFNCIIHMFSMPLFFAVNGLLFYKVYYVPLSADGQGVPANSCINKNRLSLQLKNLVILYFAYSVLYALMKIIFGGFVHADVSFSDILLLFVKPIGPFWYLYVLILFYLIFGYLIFGTDRVRNLNPIIMTGVLIVFSVAVSFIPDITWLRVRRLVYYALYFYLGTLMNSPAFEKLMSKKWLFWVCLVIAGAVSAAAWNMNDYLNMVPGVNVILALSISLMFIYSFRNLKWLKKARMFNFCGKYTLEIYVLHAFCVAACRAVFPKAGISNVFVNILMSFIVSLLLPVLISMISEKIGIHKLLFRTYSYIIDRK